MLPACRAGPAISCRDSQAGLDRRRYGQLTVPLKLQQLFPGRQDAEASEHSAASDVVPPVLSST
jgi:hypothetical protein